MKAPVRSTWEVTPLADFLRVYSKHRPGGNLEGQSEPLKGCGAAGSGPATPGEGAADKGCVPVGEGGGEEAQRRQVPPSGC